MACPPGRRMPRRPHHGPCPKRPGRPNAKARRTHGTPVGAARPLQWHEQAETTRKKERHACPACLLHDGGGALFVKPVCAVFHSVPRFCGKTRCFLLLYKRTAGVSITRFAPKTGDPGGPFWAPGLRGAHAALPPCGPGARRRRRACKGPKNQGARPFLGACGAHRARRAGGLCGGPGAAVAQAKRAKKTLRKLEEKQPGAPGCFFCVLPGLRPALAPACAGPRRAYACPAFRRKMV